MIQGLVLSKRMGVGLFDEIRNMPMVYDVPTNRPVTGPNWNVIATDWTDLLDGSIAISLQDAGVQTVTNLWYSGSNFDGSIATENCSGWTDGAAFLDGRYGRTFATDSAWIGTGATTCGSSMNHVLCLAWRSSPWTSRINAEKNAKRGGGRTDFGAAAKFSQ